MLHAMVKMPVDPERREGQVLQSIVSKGIATGNGDALDLLEVFPDCFDGIVGAPEGSNACTVSFELSASNGAICSA